MRTGKLRAGGLTQPAAAQRVTKDAFEDRDVILKYYEKQADESRLRHSAIWEEIRHYAWLLTLLPGWPVALLSAKGVSQLWRYAPYFIYLPILALWFSVIAFFVIRREFMYYNGSDAKLLYVEKVLGLT